MKQRVIVSSSKVCCLVGAALMSAGLSPALAHAQRSLVTDWSTHHLAFTNSGSESDAQMNGNHQQWQDRNNNPRYRMQQFHRSAAYADRFENFNSISENLRRHSRPRSSNSNDGLWTVSVADDGFGTAQGMYPAIYAANFSTPSCTGDFAVFTVNETGSLGFTFGGFTFPGQPNLVGFSNLYSGTCTGTTPTVKFAYYVSSGTGLTGGGTINTSPVLNLTGTQVIFVANVGTGAYLYQVTLSNTGSVAVPTRLGITSATGYTAIHLANNATVTLSSPYIDYTHNIVYVGDDSGYLHKIQNVFGSTAPSEVTTGGWPMRPSGGSVTLTGPIYDSATGDVLVSASNGNLYCVSSTNGASCGSFSVSEALGQTGGTTGTVVESPIVLDTGATSGTAAWVFAQATYTIQTPGTPTRATCRTGCGGDAFTYTYPWTQTDYAILAQAPLTTAGLGTPSGVNTGTVAQTNTNTRNSNSSTAPAGTPAYPTLTASNLYGGDFDNEFYNSTLGSYRGFMYTCGSKTATLTNGATGSTQPELYRVGFDGSTGAMDSASASIYQLASNSVTQASACTPLTEFYNASANSGAGADYLFVGVSGYGVPTKCAGDGCVMSFVLPATGAAPTAPASSYSLGGNTSGSSGMVIDNSSSGSGESQVYFSNLQTGNATQASQGALQ